MTSWCLHQGVFADMLLLVPSFKHLIQTFLKNRLKTHEFKIWNEIMHAIKVAELIFERMHFTRELAEFDISYNGEILESGVHSRLAEFYMLLLNW